MLSLKLFFSKPFEYTYVFQYKLLSTSNHCKITFSEKEHKMDGEIFMELSFKCKVIYVL